MAANPPPTRILIADFVGLGLDDAGSPDATELRRYIESLAGCHFETGPAGSQDKGLRDSDAIVFHYCPWVSTRDELCALAAGGTYSAVIAAATFIPEECQFAQGGVRIGAGTGNMAARSWGGVNGLGGSAPLMNTPGINSVATAQMVWKALMRTAPDLPLTHLSQRVMAGNFDTGRHLRDYPTRKLEGRRMAVIGFGNIGREVAHLAMAFRMEVSVFARPRHADRIAAAGYTYAPTIAEAAAGADVLSVHLGLGPMDAARGVPVNSGLIGAAVFDAMADNSILINFDRGELVDCNALGGAMGQGRIGAATIDADVFVDEATGAVSGPMAPYLNLVEEFGERLCLLPHAAADTDHPTRVAGAKQAVNQILAAIRQRIVTNLVGDLPAGYSHGDPPPE